MAILAKQITRLMTLIGLVWASMAFIACSNDLQEFCEASTTDLCAKCYSCGSSDAEGARLCGLVTAADEAECRRVLHKVCVSDDSAYNPERGAACSERVEKISCDQLQAGGKPEVCRRLF